MDFAKWWRRLEAGAIANYKGDGIRRAGYEVPAVSGVEQESKRKRWHHGKGFVEGVGSEIGIEIGGNGNQRSSLPGALLGGAVVTVCRKGEDKEMNADSRFTPGGQRGAAFRYHAHKRN